MSSHAGKIEVKATEALVLWEDKDKWPTHFSHLPCSRSASGEGENVHDQSSGKVWRLQSLKYNSTSPINANTGVKKLYLGSDTLEKSWASCRGGATFLKCIWVGHGHADDSAQFSCDEAEHNRSALLLAMGLPKQCFMLFLIVNIVLINRGFKIDFQDWNHFPPPNSSRFTWPGWWLFWDKTLFSIPKSPNSRPSCFSFILVKWRTRWRSHDSTVARIWITSGPIVFIADDYTVGVVCSDLAFLFGSTSFT